MISRLSTTKIRQNFVRRQKFDLRLAVNQRASGANVLQETQTAYNRSMFPERPPELKPITDSE
jgi:hypothetical protein